MLFIRKIYRSCLVWVILGASFQLAGAQTLSEAINTMQQTHPALKAEAQTVLARQQALPQAKAAQRPQISANITSSFVEDDLLYANALALTDRHSIGGNVNISQELYRGGRTKAGISQAKASIAAAQYGYSATTQSLIVEAVRAYMSVLLQEKIFTIRQKNIEVLAVQNTAAQARFEIGKNTRTDMAQAKASLLRAKAALSTAKANVLAANARFQELFGQAPHALSQPMALNGMPNSLRQAIIMADANNPSLLAQSKQIEALEYELKSRKGERLPSVHLNLNYGASEGLSRRFGGHDDLRLTSTLSVPLSTGGYTKSRIKQSSAHLAGAKYARAHLRRVMIRDINTRWAALGSARQEALLRREQVSAAQFAYDGVLEEQKLGRRSTFEVLNIERNLLEASLSGARSESEKIIQSALLLQTIGILTGSFN